jgi:chromosome segregation ATPase
VAKNLKVKANGPGHNVGASERPFFDRLVDLNRQIEALRQDIKEVSAEARDADIPVTPLKLAVKRHLESDEKRSSREEREAEAERILRSLEKLGPLGRAAIEAAEESGEPWSLIERHRSI